MNYIDDSNIKYYNHIAERYDQMLNNADAHKTVRKQVADIFKKAVKDGNVLDFGGGTGLDLEWLIKGAYQISFYEPSLEMRKKALHRIENLNTTSHINIIDTIDNEQLYKNQDAILANFAVLNSINTENLSDLFYFFSKATKPGGIVFVLIIDPKQKKHFFSIKYLLGVLFKIFFNKSLSYSINENGHIHKVYIHFLKDLKKASHKWFTIQNQTSLGGYGFQLIQFCCK